jgi:hypothetical protein
MAQARTTGSSVTSAMGRDSPSVPRATALGRSSCHEEKPQLRLGFLLAVDEYHPKGWQYEVCRASTIVL